MNVTLGDVGDRRTNVPELRAPDMTLRARTYRFRAPSASSRKRERSSSHESRLMLEAWTSAMVCLNGLPSASFTEVFYCISRREMIYYIIWKN